MKTDIGCDPDSTAHGIAIYVNGGLVHVKSMNLISIYLMLKSNEYQNITFHIEDNLANSSVYRQRFKSNDSEGLKAKKSQHVGYVKQAQTELERMLSEFPDIKIVHYKSSSKWKDSAGKKQFERLTGWTGRSNKDTRSGAYFGYLGSRK